LVSTAVSKLVILVLISSNSESKFEIAPNLEAELEDTLDVNPKADIFF
jgi:hypothetical protein